MTSPSKRETTRLARPRGAYILKSQAYKLYNLGATDLNAIDPISIGPNPYGGQNDMWTYNECDVRLLRAKIVELEKRLQRDAPEGETVPSRGRYIYRSIAMKQYKLSQEQMDRIRPCAIEDNRHGVNKPKVRKYNVCDVQALVDGIQGLRDMPTPTMARVAYSSVPYRDAWDEDYNMFDGLSSEDAADLFARVMNPRPKPQRTRARPCPY